MVFLKEVGAWRRLKMLKSREELEAYYKNLTQEYEGYIQMSDDKIKDVFISSSSLPQWSELHNNINYILEIALFEPSSKKSILIRQQNSEWLVLEKILNGDEPMDSYFTLTKNTPKMKIAQIWKEEPNEFCLDMEVLEAKCLMFAGFA
ncbi:MAG TPA: TIGR04423 family type III CRISPR-associated protein, partial [Sulfurospirillum arcachonense]|nr:TIGR04423 family type III CRISPR-associated protein [Sulfurospirillum arcachonense]